MIRQVLTTILRSSSPAWRIAPSIGDGDRVADLMRFN
jgi:hypothetical protein